MPSKRLVRSYFLTWLPSSVTNKVGRSEVIICSGAMSSCFKVVRSHPFGEERNMGSAWCPFLNFDFFTSFVFQCIIGINHAALGYATE